MATKTTDFEKDTNKKLVDTCSAIEKEVTQLINAVCENTRLEHDLSEELVKSINEFVVGMATSELLRSIAYWAQTTKTQLTTFKKTDNGVQ